MLLSAFLNHFEALPAERFRTLGASSAGYCARRLAYGHWPEIATPEPMSPRRRARMMAGREFERVVQGIIQAELPAHAAGETAFLWGVQTDPSTADIVREKIETRRLSGHILREMNPNDVPRWRQACHAQGMTRLGGIVLDPFWNIVYLPALADGVVDLSKRPDFAGEKYALATQEFKTIATNGFRAILRQGPDYGYRTQFAIEVDASRLDTHVAMFYRLETSHGIEIIYSRRAESVRATYTLTNGSSYVAAGSTGQPMEEWDEVIVETPFDAELLEQARARIRRVLVATPENLPAREYGPSFVCRACDGDGFTRCGYCVEGISKRSKSGAACKRCVRAGHVAGRRPCAYCDGGRLAETELGFPCSWCPFLATCWTTDDGTPLYRIEMPTRPGDAGGKPKVIMSREVYEQSGIAVERPE